MGLVTGVMLAADFLAPAEAVARARRFEELGYDQVWITDMFGREIYVMAGHLLHHTERITVATGIAHVYGRDPIASAQAARTLSELSGGRFVQGLGVSHPIASEMRNTAWEDPVAKTRAYLTAMRGELPLRAFPGTPPVPLYLAAHGPKMLAVAGEVADGADTYMQTPESIREARAIVGPSKALNVLVPTCLTTDPDAARAAGRRALAMYLPLPAYQRVWARRGFTAEDWGGSGSDRLVDTYLVWGGPDTIRERLQAYLDAGASDVILAANPDPTRPSSAEELLEVLAPAR